MINFSLLGFDLRAVSDLLRIFCFSRLILAFVKEDDQAVSFLSSPPLC